MKRNNKFLFFIIFFSSFYVYPENTKSLNECITIALGNNLDLSQSKMVVEEYESRENQALSLKYPSLSMNAFSGYTSEVPGINLDIPGMISRTMETGENEKSDLSIELEKVLFDGGKINNNYSAMKFLKESALNKTKSNENQLIFDIIKYYFQLAKFIKLREIAKDSMNQIEIHKTDALNRLEQGLLLKNDILSIDLRLLDTEQTLLKATNRILKTQIILAEKMGISLQERISIETKLDIPPPWPIPEELEIRSITRPEEDLIENQIKMAESLEKEKIADNYPKIKSYAAYHYGFPGFTAGNGQWEPYWQAGIQANWKLFDKDKNKNAVHEAQTAKDRIIKEKESLKRKIDVEILISQNDYKENYNNYNILLTRVKTAFENLKLAEDNFKAGMTSNSEYLDAQLELMKAKNELAVSSADLNISWADLLHANGLLDKYDKYL